MKTFKLSLLLLAILSIAACSDDDDSVSTCIQSDWVGTYTGTIDCNGTTEDVTITVTASGTSNVVVSYQSATIQTTYDPLPFSDCDLDATASGSGVNVSLEADLDGNNLTMEEIISDTTGVATSTCMLTATRN